MIEKNVTIVCMFQNPNPDGYNMRIISKGEL